VRVPLDWLREYCDPPLDVRAIEERLTMTGTKVEAIHHHGVHEPERFVVGHILSCERHPDADRLSVCTVDLGPASPDGPATIVCGAPNVAAGQTVAVATPGAVMPDGTKIKRAKLRGVASAGMILAEHELELAGAGEHSKGILVLDELVGDSLPAPGVPLTDILPLATDVIELEVTPNRPDCLGVYGVARELHAATGAPLAPPPWSEDPGSAGPLGGAPKAGGGSAEGVSAGWLSAEGAPSESAPREPPASVSVECSAELCPRFTARVFENVTLAESPPWLKARLAAAGQRPINNVVDITNYVMLATAQPLHAFDLDRVAGGRLVVRTARAGEQVQTLDGQTRTLDERMVVIDDAQGPTSIAGLMGGARSEVGEGTTRVLLEVATWNGPNIHRTAWALGLRSEASARFEKGLPPEQCDTAQALATRLMIELCGARVQPGTIDVGGTLTGGGAGTAGADGGGTGGGAVATGGAAVAGGAVRPAPHIHLREARVQAILGVPVPRERQREILQALDFHTEDVEDGLLVSVPPLRRVDVTREADLIEEVARIDGLEKLPATLPRQRPAGLLSPTQRLRRRAVDALVGRGLYETIGWSFTSPARLEDLRLSDDDPLRRALALENPLSEEHSLLRTTLLPSLLDSAARNAVRGSADVHIFELGTVFRCPAVPPADAGRADPQRDTGVHEHRALGALLSGRLAPPGWREADPPRADFYAVKGVLEALGAALRVELDCRPFGAGDGDGSAGDSGAAGHASRDGSGEQATGGASGGPASALLAPPPFLHPGRAATVLAGGQPAGWLGELHPLVDAWELDGAAVMELDLDLLVAAAPHALRYSDLSSHPALRQDLAVGLPAQVSAADTLAAVRAAAGALLQDVHVFDVYTGPQVGAGRRSLALALSFRAPDRTLADADVEPLRAKITAALQQLGGELRG
jgi:phenylalanyl-tRNA synthetase beta chain